MRKRGFTLIEVLATLTVLAIITLLVVTTAKRILEDSKRKAVEATAHAIIRSNSMYALDNQYYESMDVLDTRLEYDGRKPDSGDVQTTADGDTRIAMEMDGWCAKKALLENDVTITKAGEGDCSLPITSVYVSLDLNGGTVVQNISGDYQLSSIIELPEPIKEGARFEKWEVVQGDGTVTGNTLSVGRKPTTVRAVWLNNPLLTVTLNGGTTTQLFETNYAPKTQVPLINPTKTGALFTRWQVVRGNGTLSNNTLIMGSNDTEIYAMWETTPKLTVNLDGGTTTQTFDTYYRTNTQITLLSPTKEGYTFSNWQITSGNGVISGNVLTIGTQNTTIKAVYTINTYIVTLDVNNGDAWTNTTCGSDYEFNGFTNSCAKIVEYNSKYGELPTPTRVGYSFAGWYKNQALTQSASSTTSVLNEDHTLYAKWGVKVILSPVLTIPCGSGFAYNSDDTCSKFYQYGDQYGDLPTFPYGGSNGSFGGWYADSEFTTYVSTTDTVPSQAVVRLYGKVGDKVQLNLNGGDQWTTSTCSNGFIYSNSNDLIRCYAIAPRNGPYGNLLTPTRSGYTFDGWYLTRVQIISNSSSHYSYRDKVEPSTINTTNKFHIIYAVWDVTVTLNVNGGDAWNSTTCGSGNEYYIYDSSNNSCARTFTPTTGGSIYNGITRGYYGELPTPTRSGYTFDGWYTEPEFTNKVESTTYSSYSYGSHTLYAKWNMQNG